MILDSQLYTIMYILLLYRVADTLSVCLFIFWCYYEDLPFVVFMATLNKFYVMVISLLTYTDLIPTDVPAIINSTQADMYHFLHGFCLTHIDFISSTIATNSKLTQVMSHDFVVTCLIITELVPVILATTVELNTNLCWHFIVST